MDMTYSIVPVFGGENRILCSEKKFTYVVSDQNNSINHPIYDVDEDLGCFILSIYEEYKESLSSISLFLIPPVGCRPRQEERLFLEEKHAKYS
jgi:hypothetical protein